MTNDFELWDYIEKLAVSEYQSSLEKEIDIEEIVISVTKDWRIVKARPLKRNNIETIARNTIMAYRQRIKEAGTIQIERSKSRFD